MNDVMKAIRERRSDRGAYDPDRRPTKHELMQVLEAARWTPTPHNMQNFEIVVVDDPTVVNRRGTIRSRTSIEFLRENYELLSFSKEEWQKRKVGILGSGFPPALRDPAKFDQITRDSPASPLSERMNCSPVLLIVIYDPGKRAPASEGDTLGFMGLGCLMQNLWLSAHSLGLSLHILSTFGNAAVEKEVKKMLRMPTHLKIAYACRLGHPRAKPKELLRVRRDIRDFAHHNMYEMKGVDQA